MASILDNLISVLEQEWILYEELFLISVEKKKIIINNDVETLKKFNTVEGLISSKIQKLEREREEHVEDIKIVLYKDEEDLTIKKIIDLIKNEKDKNRLKKISEKIRNTLSKLKQNNVNNKTLLDSALQYIDVNLNLVRSLSGDTTDNYHPNKEKSYMEEKSAFDRRQ